MAGWGGRRGGRRLVCVWFFTNTRFLWGRKRVVYILHGQGGMTDTWLEQGVEMKARATTVMKLSWGGVL